MNDDQIMLIVSVTLMLLFCFHGGLLLYFCRYLRKRGVTKLGFFETLFYAFFGNVKSFYQTFYQVHSQEHGSTKTKALIIWHISSVVLIFALPIALAIFE